MALQGLGTASLGHYSRTRRVWDRVIHRIRFDDLEGPERIVEIEEISLNDAFQQWLIQTGLQLLNRSLTGEGVAPGLTSDQIEIVDGKVRLPPPLIHAENISDITDIVRLFQNLCVEICEDNDLVFEDLVSLRSCLDYILNSRMRQVQRHAARLFEAVFSHPIFRSAHSKMSLAKDGLEYLKHLYIDQARYNWRAEYNKFNQGKGRKYLEMITTGITGITKNAILKRVRNFGLNVDEGAQVLPHQVLPHEHTAVGVLTLMSNFSKHANDHRARLNLRGWTDEERCVMLVHHFPNEFNECFAFLWLSLVNTDWGKNNRQPNPYLLV